METDLEREYFASLTEMERKAMEIARDHLGSSFCLTRSNGFVEWFNDRKEKEKKAVQEIERIRKAEEEMAIKAAQSTESKGEIGRGR